MPFFLLAFPEVVVNPHHSPLQAFERRNVLMAKPQLVADTVRNGILHHFPECPVIPTDLVLKLSKLDKVVDGLAVIREWDCNDCVLIIIFW